MFIGNISKIIVHGGKAHLDDFVAVGIALDLIRLAVKEAS